MKLKTKTIHLRQLRQPIVEKYQESTVRWTLDEWTLLIGANPFDQFGSRKTENRIWRAAAGGDSKRLRVSVRPNLVWSRVSFLSCFLPRFSFLSFAFLIGRLEADVMAYFRPWVKRWVAFLFGCWWWPQGSCTHEHQVVGNNYSEISKRFKVNAYGFKLWRIPKNPIRSSEKNILLEWLFINFRISYSKDGIGSFTLHRIPKNHKESRKYLWQWKEFNSKVTKENVCGAQQFVL